MPIPFRHLTQYFASEAFIRPASSTGPFLETEFIGSATPSSGQLERLEFRLSLLDEARLLVCPEATGILEKGQTQIRQKCVARSAVGQITVILEIKSLASGKKVIAERVYF